MDPPLTEDGQPYGPTRYKDIARERFLISKHTNTSYEDTSNITPLERGYLLEFIIEDLERKKEMYDKAQADIDAKRKRKNS